MLHVVSVDALHLKLGMAIGDMEGLYVTLEAAEEGLGKGRLHLDTFVQVLQGYDVELDEGDQGGRGGGGRDIGVYWYFFSNHCPRGGYSAVTELECRRVGRDRQASVH